jgi:hypothetical protein
MWKWRRQLGELGPGWYWLVARIPHIGNVVAELWEYLESGPYSQCTQCSWTHIAHHGPFRSGRT